MIDFIAGLISKGLGWAILAYIIISVPLFILSFLIGKKNKLLGDVLINNVFVLAFLIGFLMYYWNKEYSLKIGFGYSFGFISDWIAKGPGWAFLACCIVSVSIRIIVIILEKINLKFGRFVGSWLSYIYILIVFSVWLIRHGIGWFIGGSVLLLISIFSEYIIAKKAEEEGY